MSVVGFGVSLLRSLLYDLRSMSFIAVLGIQLAHLLELLSQ